LSFNPLSSSKSQQAGSSASCGGALYSLVDRHFAGRSSPRAERRLREHLVGCNDCRGRYERHLLLALWDPKSVAPEQRLAAGLGLSPRSRSAPALWGALGVSFAALAILLSFRTLHVPATRQVDARNLDGEFRARGGPLAAVDAALHVYRVGADRSLLPLVEQRVSARDELAFAYQNRRGFAYLMLFAVDAGGRVYWYYPAWTDPNANPSATPIAKGDGAHPLPDAVRHAFTSSPLELTAVFTNHPWSVREIEQQIQVSGEQGWSVPDSLILRQRLELERAP
jgi:hypothetical protein